MFDSVAFPLRVAEVVDCDQRVPRVLKQCHKRAVKLLQRTSFNDQTRS